MLILQPQFWQKKGIIAICLYSFSLIYLLANKINSFFIKTYKSNACVICVGNLTIGGAGKTPLAIKIAKILIKENKKVAFLSRGYLGSFRGVVKVIPELHDAKEVGDEPLLLAKYAAVYVAKNKLEGAKEAIKGGADIIIMDDGLQNNSLAKDINILAIDASYGFGNNLLLPAGPLREKPNNALKKIDVAVLIGNNKFNSQIFDQNKTFLVKASLEANRIIKGKKFIAFAGIANPWKFFAKLYELEADIVIAKEFPDHYMYQDKDIEKLFKLAHNYKAELITTEKDYTRINEIFKKDIQTLPVEVVFKDEQLFKDILLKKVDETYQTSY